ncbi:potassium channel family protein [Cellulomonas alba]|uniref:Potassium channel family protein n=1 Tax=Cellulomonas alba TaxID=3053467 RepID=A0ABT7SFC7_9CELL|nr:potassium channel family protein [Cellulomonas alba]MDM7854891.1 potassium channel family protein [Cellulomonas alba]
MTTQGSHQLGELARASMAERAGRRAVLWAVVRSALGVVAVLGGYYLVTFDERRPTGTLAVLEILLGGLLFAFVVVIEVRAIVRARYPVLRAVETAVVSLFLFLVIFAVIYLTMSHADPEAFSESLDRTGALYFTIVTLGTVGYGDIAPVDHAARVVVSVQVLLDLAFLAVLVRVVIAAARRGLTREVADVGPAAAPNAEPGAD